MADLNTKAQSRKPECNSNQIVGVNVLLQAYDIIDSVDKHFKTLPCMQPNVDQFLKGCISFFFFLNCHSFLCYSYWYHLCCSICCNDGSIGVYRLWL